LNPWTTAGAEQSASSSDIASVPARVIEREIASALPRLTRAGKQLRATSQQIESAVVGVCDSFQAILERVSGTTKRARSLVAGEKSEKGGKRSFEELVGNCSNTLTGVLTAFEQTSAATMRTVQRIHGVEDASRQIGSVLAKLEQIARENRLLAMNARIEAANAGKLGAGFAVVAVEVASQSDRTMALTSEVNDLVVLLRNLADSTMRDVEKMQEQDRRRIESSRQEVGESLSLLRATHEEMQDTLSEITEESVRLAGDIGKSVRGLQFQDRVNQQMLHVVSDVEAVHDGLKAQLGDFVHDESEAGTAAEIYTMHEEREVAGVAAHESPEGDIDLF
jgi:methyl-accepting chemotaxis protein